MKVRCLALLLALAAALPSASWAKPAKSPSKRPPPSGNTTITSVVLDYDYENSIIRFTHDVKVVDPEFTLTGDRAVVLLEGTNDVREVRVFGHVVVVSEGRTAKADKAVFTKADNKIVLTGKASLQRGADRLSGKEIAIWLDEEKLECTPARLTSPSPLLKKGRSKNAQPGAVTTVTAEKLEYYKKDAVAIFVRHVKVADPQFNMSCDRAIVMFQTGEEVKQVRAIGNVHVTDADRECSCDEANYYRSTGFLDMKAGGASGKISIRHGSDTLETNEARLKTNEESAECSPARIIILSNSVRRKPGEGGKTVVTANRGRYNYREGAVSLENNVIVTDPQYQMTCDRALVLLKGTNELDRIKALGNVVITEAARTSRSDEAIYTQADNKAVLRGNVLVKREGDDNYWGETVDIWIGSKRVEGGRSRIQITPPADPAAAPPPPTAPGAAGQPPAAPLH